MARNPRKKTLMEYHFNCTDDLAAASVSWTAGDRQHLLLAFVSPLKPEDPQWARGYRWYATINHKWWRIIDGVPHESPLKEHTWEWCFTREQAAEKTVAHIRRLTTTPEGV